MELGKRLFAAGAVFGVYRAGENTPYAVIYMHPHGNFTRKFPSRHTAALISQPIFTTKALQQSKAPGIKTRPARPRTLFGSLIQGGFVIVSHT